MNKVHALFHSTLVPYPFRFGDRRCTSLWFWWQWGSECSSTVTTPCSSILSLSSITITGGDLFSVLLSLNTWSLNTLWSSMPSNIPSTMSSPFLQSTSLLLPIPKNVEVTSIDVLAAWLPPLTHGADIATAGSIGCTELEGLCTFTGSLLAVDWMPFSTTLPVLVNWRTGEWFLFDDFNRTGGELTVNSLGNGSFSDVLFSLGLTGCWVVEGLDVVVVRLSCVLGNMFLLARALLYRLVRAVWRTENRVN